ncbi:hypothetical protein TRFO_21966 [Tritrichomonas foetus]|uniref:Uncharacterized protein n=1 Tax=Tritrichomonas foetus TaxID=1144522 RepID=A0A1J4KE02_9EUKA|nr:hypothetical protein TRFO_21966 [Tritrichomonas foetus]|eukprot:OHT09226.1 hypothetical protein TRFO_21966 [Tritrichomonas foetus]
MNNSTFSTPTLRRTLPSRTHQVPSTLPRNQQQVEFREIEALKIQAQNLDHQRTLLRTKTSRMRRIISDRDASIKRVFTQTKDTQSLKTATNSMILLMKKNYDTLNAQKKKLLQELNSFKNCDNFWMSNELEIEDRILYEDQERLKEILEREKVIEQDMKSEVDSSLLFLAEVGETEEEIIELASSISDLQKKCDTYERGISKTKNINLLIKIQDKKLTVESAVNSIKQEINEIESKMNVERLSKRNTEESMKKALEKLEAVYEDAVSRMAAALKKRQMFCD